MARRACSERVSVSFLYNYLSKNSPETTLRKAGLLMPSWDRAESPLGERLLGDDGR